MADDDYWPGWPRRKPAQDGNQGLGPAATDIIRALQTYHPSWWQGSVLPGGAESAMTPPGATDGGSNGGLVDNAPSLPGLLGRVVNGLTAPVNNLIAPLNPTIEMQPLPARRIFGEPPLQMVNYGAKNDPAVQRGLASGAEMPAPPFRTNMNSIGNGPLPWPPEPAQTGALRLDPSAGGVPGNYDSWRYGPNHRAPGIGQPVPPPNEDDWSRFDPDKTGPVTGIHDPATTASTDIMLREIRHGEAYGDKNGDNANYNAIEGQNKTKQDYTTHTVNEVNEGQRHAVGAYQMEPHELHDTAKKLGVGNEKMTPEIQNEIGTQFLFDNGYQDYLDDRIGDTEMAQHIIRRWAAFQGPSGQGQYDKLNNNQAHIPYQELIDKLQNGKAMYKEFLRTHPSYPRMR